MNKFLSVFLLMTFLIINSCSKQKKLEKLSFDNPLVPEKIQNSNKDVAIDLAEAARLYSFPSLTVVMVPKKGVQAAIRKIIAKGGKIVYDPNLGSGDAIPFLIADLTPELINDSEFINSLELKAAEIDNPEIGSRISPMSDDQVNGAINPNIPVADVSIPDLRMSHPAGSLGENALVAVIDTGVDSVHPVFQDRIIYWEDFTDETLTSLSKTTVKNGNVTIKSGRGESEKNITIKVPLALSKATEIFVGVIDESQLVAQLDEGERMDKSFLDLNFSGGADQFFVIAGKLNEKDYIVYIDVNANSKLDKSELDTPFSDFNISRALLREGKTTRSGQVIFPHRNKTLGYAVLLNETNGELSSIELGGDLMGHGTHVAGIISANSDKLQGAAPQAKIMSLKVCSGISCTDSAILKALVEAFYNSEKLIPDVVNISLGSPETNKESIYTHIFNDLSAKFGTVFFISASNSGPGYKTINNFGNSGSTVMVGAHVSRHTLIEQYQLDPNNSDVPENNLLFFSSVGPSYTGELRPTIVAPGGAISSTPLFGEGVAQYNGTSMSSPLAAGAVAAMISAIKVSGDEGIKKLYDLRDRKINEVLNKKDNTLGSLLPMSYAIKTSLERSAKRIDGLTIVQQGHGLLNVNMAFTELISLVPRLIAGDINFFDLRINDRAMGYDRSNSIKEVQTFALNLETDGERLQSVEHKIRMTDMSVQLEKIEVQNIDGTVETISYNLEQSFFSLVKPGSDVPSTVERLRLDSRRTRTFFSRRHLARMEAGKTYLAHYSIKQRGLAVFHMVDVVHIPFVLSPFKRKMDVPAIDPDMPKIVNAWSIKEQNIKANSFHRYPFLVKKSDYNLKIQLGINPHMHGRLLVELYDPRGISRGSAVANFTPNSTGLRQIQLPLVNGGKYPGVWEVTVSAYSSSWHSSSQYDLLISSDRLGLGTNINLKTIRLKTKIAKKDDLRSSQIVSIVSSDDTVTINDVKIDDLTRIDSLHPFPIKAGKWTFKKITFPSTAVDKISVNINFKDKTDFWGRLDHYLYHMKDGKPVAVVKAQKDGATSYSRTFIDIKKSRSENHDIYVAVQTFRNYSDGLGTIQNDIDVLVAYPEIKIDQHVTSRILTESSDLNKLVEVIAPKTVSSAPQQSTQAVPVAYGSVTILTDKVGISFQLPVIIYQ